MRIIVYSNADAGWKGLSDKFTFVRTDITEIPCTMIIGHPKAYCGNMIALTLEPQLYSTYKSRACNRGGWWYRDDLGWFVMSDMQ